MDQQRELNEYTTAAHALKYLAMADSIPHRTEGEAVVLEFIPKNARRILDLGTGDGRLLALLRIDRPEAEGFALDLSPTMLEAARERFRGDSKVLMVEHNIKSGMVVQMPRFERLPSQCRTRFTPWNSKERENHGSVQTDYRFMLGLPFDGGVSSSWSGRGGGPVCAMPSGSGFPGSKQKAIRLFPPVERIGAR